MNRKATTFFYSATVLFVTFILWTVAVCHIDVAPIGPKGSYVGFSTLNVAFHQLTGVHLTLYIATDWLSLIPLGCILGFATLGLIQWIRRRTLAKVDGSILTLGGFYGIVMAAFLFFEQVVINYRPILIDGVLEASYPSSTTLLVLCVMPTTIFQLKHRIKHPGPRNILVWTFTVFSGFMVVARTISGVHWLTDIIGGVLLSAALVLLYLAITQKADP